MDGADLIKQERQRQISQEGWTPEHDDEHVTGVLALAGVCYVFDYLGQYENQTYFHNQARLLWPWEELDFKPTPQHKIKQLVKAGALIAAEIDRYEREYINKFVEKAEKQPKGSFLNP